MSSSFWLAQQQCPPPHAGACDILAMSQGHPFTTGVFTSQVEQQGACHLQVYIDSSSGQAVVIEIVVRMSSIESEGRSRHIYDHCEWP